MRHNGSHRRRVLAITHHEDTSTGLLGDALAAMDVEVDTRSPPRGDPLPRDMSGHDGVVVLGGRMSVNDPDEWIAREIDWLSVPLSAQAPVLGICLGAQMLASHLGADVRRHPRGMVEVGFKDVRPTPEGAGCAGVAFPPRFCQWHREGFGLPAGATLLASGETFAVQAFRHGRNAYGFQFHPEATTGILSRWLESVSDDLSVRCPSERSVHLRVLEVMQPTVSGWLADFLCGWLGLGPDAAVSHA